MSHLPAAYVSATQSMDIMEFLDVQKYMLQISMTTTKLKQKLAILNHLHFSHIRIQRVLFTVFKVLSFTGELLSGWRVFCRYVGQVNIGWTVFFIIIIFKIPRRSKQQSKDFVILAVIKNKLMRSRCKLKVEVWIHYLDGFSLWLTSLSSITPNITHYSLYIPTNYLCISPH